jgi:TPP-dependent pyruvate/acetoin dehydrogenase alpha subunit
MNNYSAKQLEKFETSIAELFDGGQIKFPIHLTSGNELQLIEIFKNIEQNDWVFCSWRSHYHALLKGISESKLKDAIMKGRSIALNFPEERFYSSAIVGGQLPIAVGTALGIKLSGAANLSEKVWCFLGDMTSQTGVARVAIEYSINFDLPITFVIEDNNNSVCTDTREVWGSSSLNFEIHSEKVLHYNYKSKYPHAGAGKRVQF